MTPLGDTRTHYWLVSRTAKAARVDLPKALSEGLITHADWAETVNRCRGCSDPGACAAWLDQIETGETPPGFCRNAELFAELKAL